MDGVIITLISIILIAFFSGMETAFIASDRLRIELDLKQGVMGSEIIRVFTRYPAQYISAMLTGKIISLVFYGLAFHFSFNPDLSESIQSPVLVFLIEIIISVLIILTAAEYLPKTLFSASPNFFLKYLSVPAFIFFLIFYPAGKLILAVSSILMRLASGKKHERNDNLISVRADPSGFENILTPSEAVYEPDQQHNVRIFRAVLDLSEVKLREIMVPRTEIEAVPITGTVEQLREKFISTRFSRLLVYRDTIDNITGYCEVKDIFRNPSDIKSSLRKLAVVPEMMPASRLLKMFVSEKRSIALVVDEFGGTSGMVTIEDLLEEIVGDIEDEHDTSDLVEKALKQNDYIFSGRLEIDYLNEKYDFNLPEGDDYATLAGMILFYHGSLPVVNEVIRIENIVVKILRASATRIELVNLKMEDR